MAPGSILVDFVAGSHGHFLEYITNSWFGLMDPDAVDFDLFSSHGTSHNKHWPKYFPNRVAKAEHWYLRTPERWPDRVIRISFRQRDLLRLSATTWLRAGDLGLDADQLQHDTWNKLSTWYASTRQTLADSYPDHFGPSRPNCPRFVLREFFKLGFRDPDQHGLWLEQQRMTYPPGTQVFEWPYHAFHDAALFEQQVLMLADWLGSSYSPPEKHHDLHQRFLSKLPYADLLPQAQSIWQLTHESGDHAIPALHILQESWINAMLEIEHGVEMPFDQPQWFSNTRDIRDWINERRH